MIKSLNRSLPETSKSMKLNTKKRLAGIDLLKGVAIFAVVILHSDQGLTFESPLWNVIIRFCRCAVPFFLAASFYIAVNKIQNTSKKYFLHSRVFRLVLPYAIWSSVYLLYKITKYLLAAESERIKDLFGDSVGLIFMGDSAIHLYFLPLLITGTLLIKLSENLIRHGPPLWFLISSLVGSLIISETLLTSGNAYQLSSQIALEGLAKSLAIEFDNLVFFKIISVFIVWVFMCLPYLLMAIVINKYKFDKILARYRLFSTIFLLILLVSIVCWGRVDYGQVASLGDTYAIMKGFTLLFLGISLSTFISENNLTKSLGACSFGIYLMHMIFVDGLMILEKKFFSENLFRDSTPNLLLFASISFLASWLVSSFLLRRKNIAKFIFGV